MAFCLCKLLSDPSIFYNHLFNVLVFNGFHHFTVSTSYYVTYELCVEPFRSAFHYNNCES